MINWDEHKNQKKKNRQEPETEFFKAKIIVWWKERGEEGVDAEKKTKLDFDERLTKLSSGIL